MLNLHYLRINSLEDSTTVGFAKANSEIKDLHIAIGKAANYIESPPKERHVRKIFSATSVIQPQADGIYNIHALSKRLSKTRTWVISLFLSLSLRCSFQGDNNPGYDIHGAFMLITLLYGSCTGDDNNREYDRPEARAVSSKPLKRLSKIVPATCAGMASS
ncbi:unnamed protein product [Brassica oleracea var. botrytis]